MESAFWTSGPLSAGSPVSIRREKEQALIEDGIHQESFLIIGDRNIGKTSLLKQIYAWLETIDEFEPIRADLRKVVSTRDLLSSLRSAEASERSKKIIRDHSGDFPGLVDEFRDRKIIPVFLLDEIDSLVFRAQEQLKHFEAAHREGYSRFVMTAYNVFPELVDPGAKTFRWTTGNRYSNRAIILKEFTLEETEWLFDLFERSSGIRWQDQAQRLGALDLLRNRSYRIPGFFQGYLKLLKTKLKDLGSKPLDLGSVEEILEQEKDIFSGYFKESIRRSWMPESGVEQSVYQLVCHLLLYCVLRDRYFQSSGASIDDPGQPICSPLSLGFTADDAREITNQAFAELIDLPEESKTLDWFETIDIERTLHQLTQSIFLESHPTIINQFAFSFHFLPIELQRWHGRNFDLEQMIRDVSADLEAIC